MRARRLTSGNPRRRRRSASHPSNRAKVTTKAIVYRWKKADRERAHPEPAVGERARLELGGSPSPLAALLEATARLDAGGAHERRGC